MLVAFRHIKTIEPCFFGTEACLGSFCLFIVEEEYVCCYTCIWRKDTAWQTNDGVEVELSQEFLLDSSLRPISTKEESVRKYDCCTTILCQTIHDDYHEEVCRLACCEVGREMALHVVLLITAIRRIHQNDIKPVIICIVEYIFGKGIAMIHLWRLYIVEKHIGDAKHIRELLLLYTID